jgi:hypothetical protein
MANISFLRCKTARELGKPIYLFLTTRRTRLSRGPTKKRACRWPHRQEIQTCSDIYYSFTSREELASQVLKLPLAASSAAATRRVSNLPYNFLGPLFKGRVATFVEFRSDSGPLVVRRSMGLGGVGKTRLAIEYAWRHAGLGTLASRQQCFGVWSRIAQMKTIALIDTRSEVPGVSFGIVVSTHPDVMAAFTPTALSRRPRPLVVTSGLKSSPCCDVLLLQTSVGDRGNP